MIEPIYYAYLDTGDIIVGAGRAPDRGNYDTFIAANPMAGAELIEVDKDLTSFLSYSYDRVTGEATPLPPPPMPPTPPSADGSSNFITTNQIVAALDARDHGDHSQWDALVAKARPPADDAR